jgi:hypothetical protein
MFYFYLFTKYLVFFIILAFLDNRFKNIVLDNSKDIHDVLIGSFAYSVEVLFAMFLFIFLLFIPIYLILKLNTVIYILMSFLIIVIIEYFVYEAGASFIHLDIDGLINAILSIIFFFAFFGKFIFSLKTVNKNDSEQNKL